MPAYAERLAVGALLRTRRLDAFTVLSELIRGRQNIPRLRRFQRNDAIWRSPARALASGLFVNAGTQKPLRKAQFLNSELWAYVLVRSTASGNYLTRLTFHDDSAMRAHRTTSERLGELSSERDFHVGKPDSTPSTVQGSPDR